MRTRDIYTMDVKDLKIEERFARNRLREIRRLIQKRNRGWLPPENNPSSALSVPSVANPPS